MTIGISFLYSECSNSQIQKGTCHVNKYICFSKSIPGPSRACHRADHPLRYRCNYWIPLDTYRPRYCTSRFEVSGSALDTVHLPVSSSLGRRVCLMLFIHTAPKGEF